MTAKPSPADKTFQRYLASRKKAEADRYSPAVQQPPQTKPEEEQRRVRRRRCHNCDEKFQPGNHGSPQKFCSGECRREYHALLGGSKIRAAVVKMVEREIERHMPAITKQVKAEVKAEMFGPRTSFARS